MKNKIFDEPVIGAWDEHSKGLYLEEIGDEEPTVPQSSVKAEAFLGRKKRAWEHSEHLIGYIHVDGTIESALSITSDASLSKIDIRLDRLRVFDYPGRGRHFVLLTFKATNEMSGSQETIAFNQTYLAQEKEAAGVTGYPIFRDLSVGRRGAALEVGTVNVKNENDERALSFLDSPEFNQGVQLLTTAQPALAPLTGVALGLTKLMLRSRQNVPVQQFYLGLDHDSPGTTGARLRKGPYIAVQAPDISWGDWRFESSSGRVVSATSGSLDISYNYLIFRVTASPE